MYDTAQVTRKGATSAKRGELGLIPGSMQVRLFCAMPTCMPSAPHRAVDLAHGILARAETSVVMPCMGRLMLLAVQVGSYVTRGKGNAQSWSSCSHGAGRKLSRTKAIGTIAQVNA